VVGKNDVTAQGTKETNMYQAGDVLNTKDGRAVPNAVVLQSIGEDEKHGYTFRVVFENGKTAIMPAKMMDNMFHEPEKNVEPGIWMAEQRHNWQQAWSK